MDQIDYKAVLADLKARRVSLDQAIAGIEAILGEVTSSSPGNTSPNGTKIASIHADTFLGHSIADASTKYLGMVGRPARPTDEIVDALTRGGLNTNKITVSTMLLRVAKEPDGRIARAGRGLWGLAEWYPNRPRPVGKRRRGDDSQTEEGSAEKNQAES